MARVLVVDDDSLLRDALRKTLERAGYSVEEASDGTVALQAYKCQRCEVVITDIVMPNIEGLDMIRALRRMDPDVKIIAISGGGVGATNDYLDLAHKLGAMKILAKPFSGEEILAVVAEVIAAPIEKDLHRRLSRQP